MVPLGQAANFNGQLLEGIWNSGLGSSWLLGILLCSKDIAIVVAMFIFRRQLLLKRIEKAGKWWALEGTRSTSRQGILCGGSLEASEGLGGMEGRGSVCHDGMRCRRILANSRVSALEMLRAK